MKMQLRLAAFFAILLCFAACGQQELAEMTTAEGAGYVAIVWGEKTYVPYCAVSKQECAQQFGIVNGDRDDKIYAYQNYSRDEWIINAYAHDSAMLYRELAVTDIPEALISEYAWNQTAE